MQRQNTFKEVNINYFVDVGGNWFVFVCLFTFLELMHHQIYNILSNYTFVEHFVQF